MKTLLIISISLNILLGLILVLLAYKYREEITQRIINRRHNPSLIMYGDSHTTNGKWNSLIKHHRVLRIGWGGASSEQLAGSIVKVVEYNPKYVIILCGGNDLSRSSFSVSHTMGNFRKMTRILREHQLTPVFQKLFYHHDDPDFDVVIDSINHQLEEYCEREQLDFIDVTIGMNDSTGLKKSLTTDGAHLNSEGYKVWAANLNKYLAGKN